MKPLRVAVIIVLICLYGFLAQADAVIEGRVKLPPANQALSTPSRYQTKTSGEVAPPTRLIAVIYLEGEFPEGSASATNGRVPLQVAQEHFQFSPPVLAVRTGTVVEFPNLDDAYHNVFSYSKTKRFDLGRYRKDEKPASVLFDKPGVVKLYCEIHEHMRGTILVLDTPHFTHTDTNGVFRLEHLSAGKFTLKAWLNEKTELTRSIELTNGATVRVDLDPK